MYRVLFQESRAVAVEYEKDGRILHVQARREVLMATGSIGSPSLLQRSGIGSAHHLEPLGIDEYWRQRQRIGKPVRASDVGAPI